MGADTIQISLRIPRKKLKGLTPEKDSRGAAFSGPGAELVVEQGDRSGQSQEQPWLPAASAIPAVGPAEITGL